MHPRAKLRAAMNQLAHLAEWYMAVLPEALTYVSSVTDMPEIPVIETARDESSRAGPSNQQQPHQHRQRQQQPQQQQPEDQQDRPHPETDQAESPTSHAQQPTGSACASRPPRSLGTQRSTHSRETQLQLRRRRSRRITKKRGNPSVTAGPRFFLIQRHLQSMQERRERLKQRSVTNMLPRRAFSALPYLDAKTLELQEEEEEFLALVQHFRNFTRFREDPARPYSTHQTSTTQVIRTTSTAELASDAPSPSDQAANETPYSPTVRAPPAAPGPSNKDASCTVRTPEAQKQSLPMSIVLSSPSQDDVPIPRLQLRRRPAKSPVRATHDPPRRSESNQLQASSTADHLSSSTQTISPPESAFRVQINHGNVAAGLGATCQLLSVASNQGGSVGVEQAQSPAMETTMKVVGAVLVLSPAHSTTRSSAELTTAAAQVLLDQDQCSRLIPRMCITQRVVTPDTTRETSSQTSPTGRSISNDGVCINYISQTVASSATASTDYIDSKSVDNVSVVAVATKPTRVKFVDNTGALTDFPGSIPCHPRLQVTSEEATSEDSSKNWAGSSDVKQCSSGDAVHSHSIPSKTEATTRSSRSRLPFFRTRCSKFVRATSKSTACCCTSRLGKSTMLESPSCSQRIAGTRTTAPSSPALQTAAPHSQSVSIPQLTPDSKLPTANPATRHSQNVSSRSKVLTAETAASSKTSSKAPSPPLKGVLRKEKSTLPPSKCTQPHALPPNRVGPSPSLRPSKPQFSNSHSLSCAQTCTSSSSTPPRTSSVVTSPDTLTDTTLPQTPTTPSDIRTDTDLSQPLTTISLTSAGPSSQTVSSVSFKNQRNRSVLHSTVSPGKLTANARKPVSVRDPPPLCAATSSKKDSRVAGDSVSTTAAAHRENLEQTSITKARQLPVRAKTNPETLTTNKVLPKRPVQQNVCKTPVGNEGASKNVAANRIGPVKLSNKSKLHGPATCHPQQDCKAKTVPGAAKTTQTTPVVPTPPGMVKPTPTTPVVSTRDVKASLKNVHNTAACAKDARRPTIDLRGSDTQKPTAKRRSTVLPPEVPAQIHTTAIDEIPTPKTTIRSSDSVSTKPRVVRKDDVESHVSGNTQIPEQDNCSSSASSSSTDVSALSRCWSPRIDGNYRGLVSCLRRHERLLRSVAARRGKVSMLPCERLQNAAAEDMSYEDYLDALRYHLELVRLVSQVKSVSDDTTAGSSNEDNPLHSTGSSLLLLCAEAYLSRTTNKRDLKENV